MTIREGVEAGKKAGVDGCATAGVDVPTKAGVGVCATAGVGVSTKAAGVGACVDVSVVELEGVKANAGADGREGVEDVAADATVREGVHVYVAADADVVGGADTGAKENKGRKKKGVV